MRKLPKMFNNSTISATVGQPCESSFPKPSDLSRRGGQDQERIHVSAIITEKLKEIKRRKRKGRRQNHDNTFQVAVEQMYGGVYEQPTQV